MMRLVQTVKKFKTSRSEELVEENLCTNHYSPVNHYLTTISNGLNKPAIASKLGATWSQNWMTQHFTGQKP